MRRSRQHRLRRWAYAVLVSLAAGGAEAWRRERQRAAVALDRAAAAAELDRMERRTGIKPVTAHPEPQARPSRST